MKLDSESREREKNLRAQRQQQEFTMAFDKRAFELVISKLKVADKVTVSDLIPLLADEGFFKLYRYAITSGKLEQEVITDPKHIKQLKFDTWARKRVLGLAKWWASNEVAFIGAQVAQGHPYLFYLGKKPDAIFDPSMPKKSIAQRSVNKVARALEKIKMNSLNSTESTKVSA
jgi:hypothetical protein